MIDARPSLAVDRRSSSALGEAERIVTRTQEGSFIR